MIPAVPVGSKEYLIVDLKDRLETLTALDTVPLTFRVVQDTGTEKLAWGAAVAGDGLKVLCLVDTTGWTPDDYDLFVKLDIAPEAPIVGPFRFRVG